MSLRRVAALLAASSLTVLLLAAGSGAAAPRAAGAGVTASQAGLLGREAWEYGFPLLDYLGIRASQTSVRCPDHDGNAPVNTFSNAVAFATPADTTVVGANVDTLYSIANLDLGRGPVVLSHPDMGGRYFVFQLMDPYTNVFAYVGSRTTGPRAGRFAITWTGHPGRRVPGATVIRSAYRRVWIVGRTLAGDRADQLRAIALMRQYQLTPPGGPVRFPRGCQPGRPTPSTTPTGLAFLDALGQALVQNPPPSRDRPLLTQLATVGVGPGLRPERAGLAPDLLSALVERVDLLGEVFDTIAEGGLETAAALEGGWVVPAPDTGNFGTDYVARAGDAELALAVNTPQEAMYIVGLTDSTGKPLEGGSSYTIVFPKGEAPPARAFWSLTVYNSLSHLVANPANRYAVGSSHPPLIRRPDGSIVIALQSAQPTEAGVNWLPIPATGAFRLTLRIYWPEASALDHTWRPPSIQRTGP